MAGSSTGISRKDEAFFDHRAESSFNLASIDLASINLGKKRKGHARGAAVDLLSCRAVIVLTHFLPTWQITCLSRESA